MRRILIAGRPGRLATGAMLVALLGCEAPDIRYTPGPTPVERTVNFRFTPQANSGYAKQTLLAVDLSAGEELQFQLKPSHRVRGWIWNPDTLFGGMQATVTFFSRATVPGVRAPRYAATTDAEKADEGFPFTLELPGGLYDVLIEPSDSELPPVWFRSYLVDQSGDMKPFHYVPSEELNTVSGKVHRKDADQSEFRGLLVRGFDDLGGFPVSTIAETGEDGGTGDYTLTFPPGKGPYTLRVWPPTDSDGIPQQYLPTNVYTGWIDFEDLDTGETSSQSLRVNLPVLIPEDYVNNPVTVHGVVTSAEEGSAVESVLVRYSATVAQNPKERIDSTFTAETLTDRDGQYLLDVVPGFRYTVTASPPATSELGIFSAVTPDRIQPDVNNPGYPAVRTFANNIRLQDRISVTVRILEDETGRPVRGSRHNRAVVVSDLTGGEAENVSVANEADGDGICRINLDDSNTYDLTVYPPEGSGLAMHTVRNYFPPSGGPRELEVRLQEGVWIVGRILTDDGEPLGGLTLVEVFDEPPDTDDARKIGDGANLGFTWPDGSFRCLIPPPEED